MSTMLLVAGAAWGQDPIKPTPPLRYDLSRPLCQQMQLSPELIGALTPPSAAVLGVPAAVTLAAPVAGVGAVRLGGVAAGGPGAVSPMAGLGPSSGLAGVAPVDGLSGVGAVMLSPGLPAPSSGGQSAVVLARLRAGDSGPELEAALRKVPAADLLAEVRRCPWWSEKDQPISDRLMTVLIERGEIDPRAPEKLDYTLALAVAECLRRKVDGRCVPVYEELLKRREGKTADGWLQEVWGLGIFLRRTHRSEQAASTWLHGAGLTSDEQSQADYLLEAARDHERLGQQDLAADERRRARPLARNCGAAWLQAVYASEEARHLVSAGQYAEAVAVLSDRTSGTLAAEGDLLLQAELGICLFRAGDWLAAQTVLRAALASVRARADWSPLARSAGEVVPVCLGELARFEAADVLVDRDHLTIRVAPGRKATREVAVTTLSTVGLTVHADPCCTAEFKGDWRWDFGWHGTLVVTTTARADGPSRGVVKLVPAGDGGRGASVKVDVAALN